MTAAHEHRIHIFGASGSGTTTLGRALAARLGVSHFDTDDYFWVPVEPLYTVIRERVARLEMLTRDLDRAGAWVSSGSLVGWGDPLMPRFTLAVFATLDRALRLERLAARERARYGAAIEPGGVRHRAFTEFMEWAGRYDAGEPVERSLRLHEAWIERLPCPVLRIDSRAPVERLVDAVVGAVDALPAGDRRADE